MDDREARTKQLIVESERVRESLLAMVGRLELFVDELQAWHDRGKGHDDA